MSVSSILPDKAVFADFKHQCLSTDNWLRKYDDSGMQVWVEQSPTNNVKGNNVSKVHKIKVSSISLDIITLETMISSGMWYLSLGGPLPL